MSKVTSYQEFKNRLNAMPLATQRQVAAKFIGEVLDLAADRRIRDAAAVAGNTDSSAEEMDAAYHAVHAYYTETNPQSDLLEMDFTRQAAHFVAEACLVSLSPIYEKSATHHLAQKVAMYCRMARTCSSMKHDADQPNFSALEPIVGRQVENQYRIVEEFS